MKTRIPQIFTKWSDTFVLCPKIISGKIRAHPCQYVAKGFFRLSVSTFLAVVLSCLFSCSPSKIDQIDEAAENGDLEKVKIMLKGEPGLIFSKAEEPDPATPERGGWTPLHFAAAHGHTDIVKYLLANKAVIEAKDKYGETPLQLAAYNGQTKAAELLLASNADVNAQSKSGEAPLDLAAGAGHIELVKMLLDKKADIDAKSMEGCTALDVAAATGHEAIVELLVAKGADINATNNAGETPLKRAENFGFANVAAYLRQHGGHD